MNDWLTEWLTECKYIFQHSCKKHFYCLYIFLHEYMLILLDNIFFSLKNLYYQSKKGVILCKSKNRSPTLKNSNNPPKKSFKKCFLHDLVIKQVNLFVFIKMLWIISAKYFSNYLSILSSIPCQGRGWHVQWVPAGRGQLHNSTTSYGRRGRLWWIMIQMVLQVVEQVVGFVGSTDCST